MDAKGAGIYGSQGRDDFDREDVAQVIVLLLLLLLLLPSSLFCLQRKVSHD
jgi:hypothetical protein